MKAEVALWAAFSLGLGLCAAMSGVALALGWRRVLWFLAAFLLVTLRAGAGLLNLYAGTNPALLSAGAFLGPAAAVALAFGALNLAGGRLPFFATGLSAAALAWTLTGAATGFSPIIRDLPAELAAFTLCLFAARAARREYPLLCAGLVLAALRSPAHILLTLRPLGPALDMAMFFGLWTLPAAGVVHALFLRLREAAECQGRQAASLKITASRAAEAIEGAWLVIEPSSMAILTQNQRAAKLFTHRPADLWSLAAPGKGMEFKDKVWEALAKGDGSAKADLFDGKSAFAAEFSARDTDWNGEPAIQLVVADGAGLKDNEDLSPAPPSAGLAHDLKNVFQVILSSAELLLMRGAKERELKGIAEAARTGGDLARNFYDPSHTARTLGADPALILEKLARTLPAGLGEGVAFNIEAKPGLLTLAADPAELERALTNLVLNAGQALGGKGTVLLTASQADAGVLFAVEDDGPGLDPAILGKLGREAVTTKGAAGTGLGLMGVMEFTRRAGGTLTWGTSKLGGALFTLTLRRHMERKPPILIVEPDDRLRGELDRALKLAGREVFTARDGERALGILSRSVGPAVGVVITDLVLPGMSGRGLLEHLKAKRPEISALVHSSIAADEARAGALRLGAKAFLAKPVNIDEVARRVLAL